MLSKWQWIRQLESPEVISIDFYTVWMYFGRFYWMVSYFEPRRLVGLSPIESHFGCHNSAESRLTVFHDFALNLGNSQLKQHNGPFGTSGPAQDLLWAALMFGSSRSQLGFVVDILWLLGALHQPDLKPRFAEQTAWMSEGRRFFRSLRSIQS